MAKKGNLGTTSALTPARVPRQYHETVKVAIADLKENPQNAREHSRGQIKKLAEVVAEYGFLGAIIIDGNNRIVAGHARVAAAKMLGMTEIHAIRVDHLTESQVRGFILADNKIAELAKWNKVALKAEFEALIDLDVDFDLSLTGFEQGEIDVLLMEDVSVADDEDTAGFLQNNPVARSGDLFVLGRHRIFCGNALAEESYAHLLGAERAAMIISDPPFNVPIRGHVSGLGKVNHMEFAMAAGEMTPEEYTAFLESAFRLMAAYAVDGSLHFVFIDWRHLQEMLAAGKVVYTEFKNLCVWAKDNAGMGSLYRSQHELVLIFKHGKAPHINNVELGRYGRHRSNLWRYPGQNTFHGNREEELAMHPTVKPVAMIADAILDCSNRGDIILDPFGGSGTTLLAAEKTGRCARLIEFEPRYVDVTIRRWQALTGQDAVHAVTKKTFNQQEKETKND
jgi:DNA modification methylase